MIAIEVYINGEKKCVAGIDDGVLSAIINATQQPYISVGGIVRKDGTKHYADWIREPLQTGDEVRIRFIETDEADAPQEERPFNAIRGAPEIKELT